MLCNPPPRSIECRLRKATCLLAIADWRQAATHRPARASTYSIERSRHSCTIRNDTSAANRSRKKIPWWLGQNIQNSNLDVPVVNVACAAPLRNTNLAIVWTETKLLQLPTRTAELSHTCACARASKQAGIVISGFGCVHMARTRMHGTERSRDPASPAPHGHGTPNIVAAVCSTRSRHCGQSRGPLQRRHVQGSS